MTELEERLRRELRELRPRPESVRPLRIPPPRRFGRTRRWLIPLAAAAAVVVVIVVVTVGSGLTGGGSAPAGPTAPMTARVAKGLPRYYVVAFQRYINNGRTIATYAAVHKTATGAALVTVRVPTLLSGGGANAPSITAAADDRTFIVIESGQTSVHDVLWCFLLRVAPDGRTVKLTKLKVTIPASVAIDDAALSPDGTRLEMTAQWGCGKRRCDEAGIRVVDLATGSVRRWTTQVNGAPFNGSWVGNDEVAFEWQSSLRHPPAGQGTGYRLLSVTGTGGNLLSGPAIASPGKVAGGYVPDAFVSPDGKDVITSGVGVFNGAEVARVVEMSASSGRILRVLYRTGSWREPCNVLSLGPQVSDPIVACPAVGVLEHGTLVTLRGFPSPSSSGISGQEAIAW